MFLGKELCVVSEFSCQSESVKTKQKEAPGHVFVFVLILRLWKFLFGRGARE